MARAFPWLAAQPPPPPTPPALLAELEWVRRNLRVDGGMSTGTRSPPRSIYRVNERFAKGAWGQGLRDPGARIGGAPRAQQMEGTRGCIGAILPCPGFPQPSLFHRQAAVNLSGKGERAERDLKRKRRAWLLDDSVTEQDETWIEKPDRASSKKFKSLPSGKLVRVPTGDTPEGDENVVDGAYRQ
jgi:hypothetical protein